jgi:hypothetical protein
MSERADDQRLADDLRARYEALANAPRPSMGDAAYRHALRRDAAARDEPAPKFRWLKPRFYSEGDDFGVFAIDAPEQLSLPFDCEHV